MLKKILLPTDFSKKAEKLLDSLSDLKEMGLEELLLVHVVNAERINMGFMGVEERAQQRLNKLKEKIEEMDLKAETLVNIGYPSDEIVKISEGEDCDLILVSSHGKSLLKELFLGSTTHNIIRKTKTPVLIEKYKESDNEKIELQSEKKSKNIMLPIDFSRYSYEVIEKVKNIYSSYQNIILISVIESSENEKELKKQKQDTLEKLNKIKDLLVDANISENIKVEVAEGMASKNIINIAKKEKVNLIIMSTLGSGNIKNLLLGSTADRVARRSPVPVLLIPR